MNKQTSATGHWEASTAKNGTRVLIWALAWVLTTALAAFGPKVIWEFHTGLTILGVLVNVGVGIGMIFATKRHLQGLDEMHQKIFRDAAVLSLGVGLVFASSYELLEDIRLIAAQPEISHVMILMCLAFLVGIIAGHRKYR
jgi:hypothetical protein